MNADPASLQNLHDVIVPAAVPFWPPAPAWHWVLALAGFLLAALLFRVVIHWQRNRYRREALAVLRHAAPAPAALAELLKRAVLSAWPREQVASLTGMKWQAFLDRSGRTLAFSQGPGAVLETAAYDACAAASLDDTQTRELRAAALYWIKHHHVEPAP